MTTEALTRATIAAAESIAGVLYTDAERDLMLGPLAAQVERAAQRRAVALPSLLGPATRFDPRLPGFSMPDRGAFQWTPQPRPLPQHETQVAFAPMTDLAGWIRSRQITSEGLTQLYLRRIERHAGILHCFALVTAEAALRHAAELDAMLDAGTWLGPLHGIPYGLKDIIDTAGIATEWGAEPYQGRVPDRDAFVATALHAAGAVLLGKTSVGALAYGDVWHGGRTRNPWNPGEGSSGSSAGSAAAVAAGLCGFSIGTETLGSIVSPSARCGTTGLRPTYGRVSRRGTMPLCWSLDKIGPICRAVEDTALVLHAIGGADPEDPFQIAAPLGYDSDASIAGLRLGYYEEDFAREEASPLDRAALDAARSLGAALVPLQRRPLPYDALTAILQAEAAAAFEELTLSGRDDLLARQDEAAWPNAFRKARFLSAVEHVPRDRLRRLVMQEMEAAFGQADVIMGPALGGPMTIITNFTGHPCLCLRAGFERSPNRTTQEPLAAPSRVPRAICLWGKLFDEGPMLETGRALEMRLGVAEQQPIL